MHRDPLPYPSRARSWLTVLLLMLVYVLSFIDRQILTLMVDPIRRDLNLGEVEVSLLMGFSFALFYALCGLPMGYLVDTRPRNRLILAGLVVWTLMTAFGGLARNYWMLFFSRMGVGVGEAALSPAAYSLIADSFPPERRATAISLYTAGASIGLGLALLVGGLVIQWAQQFGDVTLPLLGTLRSWQFVLLLAGGTGLLFAPLVLLVREPERRTQGGRSEASFRELRRWLMAHRRAYLCHNVGFGLLALALTALAIWAPTYFSRVHGMSAGAIGVRFGLIIGIGGTLAILFGGVLSDFLRRRGRSTSNLIVGLIGAVLALPSIAIGLSASSANVAMFWMLPAFFMLVLPFGAAPAAVQEMTPPRLRGQASALYLLATSMFQYGIGPTAVAAVTQYVYQADNAVGQSLLWVCSIALAISALALLAGLAPYRRSVQAAVVAALPR
jgi:MFS family permease